MLGVDGDEELHDLPRVEAVEEHGGDLDAEVLARLGQGVQGEEAVLAVQDAKDPVLLGDLQQAEIVLTRHRGEGEALLGGDDDGAGNGGQRSRLLAVAVVADQLVDLATDHRALIGRLALADALFEHFPVHAGAVGALGLRGGGVLAGIAEDLELHQAVDVLGGERRLEELDPELFHPMRGNRDHSPSYLRRGNSACAGRGVWELLYLKLKPLSTLCVLAMPRRRGTTGWARPAIHPQAVGNVGTAA
jgi:hypothetical protein